jgi:hypothetical protein
VRNSVGNYTATLPSLTKTGGYIQITADSRYIQGSTPIPARCKTSGWTSDSSNTYVNISCFDSGGWAADEYYTLSYSIGEPFAYAAGTGANAAYEWADKPTDTTAYKPPAKYEYNSFGTGSMTAQNTGTGLYMAAIPGTPSFSTSTVLATAVGSDSSYCNVTGWLPITVACFAQGGTPVDTEFAATLQAVQ